MEHDLKVPEVFDKFKSIPFMKHAVIAGGFLRDQLLGIEVSDVDVFVPYTSSRGFTDSFWEYFTQGNFPGISITDHKAGDYDEHQFVKYDFTYDGLDYDLMGVRLNVGSFGNDLVERFPFGNQQIFFDGKKVSTTDAFDSDFNNHHMTLKNCRSIKDLPNLMEKFKKVSDKYRQHTGQRMTFATDYVLQKATGDDWL